MRGLVNVAVCSETGACSIVRADGSRIDLMPSEVQALRKVRNDPVRARAVLKEADYEFGGRVADAELLEIGRRI